jgi:hypothetical protein
MNMQNGLITHEHPLDVVYRDRVQQEKKLKEQTRMMQQRQMPGGANSDFIGGQGGQPLMLPGIDNIEYISLGKHDDPLIKAEIDKNIKEQRKLLE